MNISILDKHKNNIFYFLLFIIINSMAYFITQNSTNHIVNNILQNNLNRLETSYSTLLETQKHIAYAISQSIIRNTEVRSLLNTTLSKEEQAKNRKRLYSQLIQQYKTAKEQGVLQIHFVDKNNISFLRMNKPSKFGDDLTKIRPDYKFVNETKKPIRAFVQGRLAHGFRNDFPIFDKKNRYIGAMEVSFSSDNFEWYFDTLNKLHTHFLINRKVFSEKSWENKSLVIQYNPSIENKNYMTSNLHYTPKECVEKSIVFSQKLKDGISSKMLKGESFTYYVDGSNGMVVSSLLAIKNMKGKTIAWFVTYRYAPVLENILNDTLVIRVLMFLFSIILIVLIHRRIREAKHKNDYEAMFKYSQAGIAIVDLESNFIDFNDAHSKITGFTREELLNRSCINLSVEKDIPRSIEAINRTIKEGFVSKYTKSCIRKDGAIVDVESSLVLMPDKKRILISVKDITESNRVRKELSELNDIAQKEKNKAIATSKAKSEFLANMSHEIRTPLNAIMGFIDILQEQEKDKEKLKYLNVVSNSSLSLVSIINDILDFSKIESGKLDIEYINFNPMDELKYTKKLFQPRVKEKDVHLFIGHRKLPEILNGDILRIKQVINNLLSNAVKFTPSGKNIYLDINYENANLCVQVRDEGIGISEEYQTRIFEAFSQADSSTTRKYGGTGLGLTISYNLVKLMGGTLQLKSKLGEGSEFYFKVPMREGRKILEKKKDDININLKNKKVLLVEDNKANQLFMKVLFKKMGLEFDIAQDGLESIELFKVNSYDVILMDENMPNMDGTQATKKILEIEDREKLEHTPIVALTANALKGDKERFLSNGMDDYLTKPLDKEKLVEVLNKILS